MAGCRNDHFHELQYKEAQSHPALVSKIISLNESAHKERLKQELHAAKQILNHKSTNTLGKMVNIGDSAKIDTDRVVYIQNHNYHSYIFRIERNNVVAGDPIDNLMLTPNGDGTYREYLVQYYLSEQELYQVNQGAMTIPASRINMIELTPGTYNNGQLVQSMSQNCQMVFQNSYYTSCSENKHHNGEQYPACTADVKSAFVIEYAEICESYEEGPPPGYNPAWPGGDLGGGSGGSLGPPCPTCPATPVECTVLPTDPGSPSTGIGDDGCTPVIPIIPNLPIDLNDPCEKTKALLAKTEVTDKIQDLKDHAANGTGEKGYKFMKDGSPPQQTTNNGPHSVNYGDPSLLNGAYHNHTGTTVDIFSASDISTLIEIARYQGVGSIGNAFHGMVAPNGIHYVIQFTGPLVTDLPSGHYNSSLLRILDGFQIDIRNDLFLDSNYYSMMNGEKVLNSKGLETIFFETLKYMGLQNKIELQKIDANNNVSAIKQNPDGTIADPIPCP